MLYKPHNELPEWASFENLYYATKKCCNNVRWKTSVTQYEINIISNTGKLVEELRSGTYKLKPYTEFDVYEPKKRHITATRISDRVVQRSFCDNYFYNVITKSFIYDNCACQLGKGIDFALDRFKKQLKKFWTVNRCNDGYFLKCDIHHFFENIDHNRLKELLVKKIDDEFSLQFIFMIIDSFGERGLGLGSQVSQILALLYLDELDHIIKEKFYIKLYIRYMDDFILIHKDKQVLLNILHWLNEYLPTIGLSLNGKTVLQSLKYPITFLKWKMLLTISGKILMKPDKHELANKRKKIRTIIYKYHIGKITKQQLIQSISGIINHLSKGNSYNAIREVQKMVKEALSISY